MRMAPTLLDSTDVMQWKPYVAFARYKIAIGTIWHIGWTSACYYALL